MDPSGLRFRASASSKGRSSANLISEMSSRSDRGVQVKENVQNWAASDDPKKKTPSRKFVEKYLMNVSPSVIFLSSFVNDFKTKY
jgi:hypothetical protein